MKSHDCLAADEGASRRYEEARSKAQLAGELIREADLQQQAAEGDEGDLFPVYLEAKREFQESRSRFRKTMRKLLLQRGDSAEQVMVSKPILHKTAASHLLYQPQAHSAVIVQIFSTKSLAKGPRVLLQVLVLTLNS